MDSTTNKLRLFLYLRKNWLQRVTASFLSRKKYLRLETEADIITALLIPILSALFGGIAGIMLTYRTPDFIEKMNQLPDKGNPQTILLAGLIIGIIFALIFSLGALLLKSGIIHVFAPFLNGKGDISVIINWFIMFSSLVFSFCYLYMLSAIQRRTSFISQSSCW
jgi:hypothetical protein